MTIRANTPYLLGGRIAPSDWSILESLASWNVAAPLTTMSTTCGSDTTLALAGLIDDLHAIEPYALSESSSRHMALQQRELFAQDGNTALRVRKTRHAARLHIRSSIEASALARMARRGRSGFRRRYDRLVGDHLDRRVHGHRCSDDGTRRLDIARGKPCSDYRRNRCRSHRRGPGAQGRGSPLRRKRPIRGAKAMTHRELQHIGFFVMMFSMLVAGSLFIAFGQITVRKLRRNPATRHHLGIDWVNGEDIAHVAQALSWPRRLQARAERGALSCMVANSEIIRQHTTRLDRALARLCYWSAMLCLVILLGTGLIVNPR